MAESTNTVLAIAPNKHAFNSALRMKLIPPLTKYIGTPVGIKGFDNPIVYVINYGYRSNQVWIWGSSSADKRRQAFMRELEFYGADIREVVLP